MRGFVLRRWAIHKRLFLQSKETTSENAVLGVPLKQGTSLLQMNTLSTSPDMTSISNTTFNPNTLLKPRPALLVAALTSLALLPLHGFAAALTMEDNMMPLMESAVSRNINISNYETPVEFQRNSKFNQTQITQPGWMLNATAIGNLVNVQVKGAGNTVVVNAVQMNSGNQMSVISHGADVISSSDKSNATQVTNTTVSTPGASSATSATPGTYGK